MGSEGVRRHFAIPKDPGQQADADIFTGVNWNDGVAAVGMLQKVVAAFDANDLEARLSKCSDDLLAGNTRQLGHCDTLTRCTPTNSKVSGTPSTSRHKSMAS